MGVASKAILRVGITIQEIEKAMVEKFKEVAIHPSGDNYFWITFQDGKDERQMAVSFWDDSKVDYGISGVWVSLGFWGNSVEILKYLCETFGGYIDENDCDDEGFYPINFELFSTGKDFTPLDIFKHKVIKEFGYQKLNIALALLEEYKTI